MKFFKNAAALLTALVLCTGAGAASVSASYAEVSIEPVETIGASAYPTFNNYSDAAAYVRGQMKMRNTSISVCLPKSGSVSDILNSLMKETLSETGKSDEGDYLRLSTNGYNASYTTYGMNYIVLIITFKYNSTAAQEAEVAEKVSEILDSLQLDGKSDYQKAKDIYTYLVSNCTYASSIDDQLVFSAYGALINKTAVCQGFAGALYRLYNEAGISCRTIAGTSEDVSHVWNIAELDGYYYLLDSTWDSAFKGKVTRFFMKGTDDFDEYAKSQPHVTDPPSTDNWGFFVDYTSEDFTTNYPIHDKAYDPASPDTGFVLGDVNKSGKIDGKDAALILRAYAELSSNRASGLNSIEERAADVNNDKKITGVDASYVLSYYADLSANAEPMPMDKYIEYLKNKR